MADCQIEGCTELTSGTTFLCEEHWLSVTARRQAMWRWQREQFRRHRTEVNYRAMNQAQALCLLQARFVLERESEAA